MHEQAKKALKLILNKCLHLPALDSLLKRAPASILKYVVAQYSKILPHNPSSRRLFVTTGGLKKVSDCIALSRLFVGGVFVVVCLYFLSLFVSQNENEMKLRAMSASWSGCMFHLLTPKFMPQDRRPASDHF